MNKFSNQLNQMNLMTGTLLAALFIIALACHGILAKYIYAHPPIGVPSVQAKTGGMLMYYGGDAIDLILITLLCYQWSKRTLPRTNETYKQLS